MKCTDVFAILNGKTTDEDADEVCGCVFRISKHNLDEIYE